MTNTTDHPFDVAGLGRPPYAIVGMSRETYQACHGAPVQPGGSCDYCGQGITYQVRVRSADGAVFKVGCDCAEKAEPSWGRTVQTFRNDEQRKLARVAREKRNAKRRATAAIKRTRDAVILSDMLADPRTVAAAEVAPHPSIAGKTLADYVDWCQANGANPAKLIAALTEARKAGPCGEGCTVVEAR